MAAKNAKSTTPEQHRIAEVLLELCNNVLRRCVNERSGYIALDRQLGKSMRYKNAVSILSNRVSFMVANFDTATCNLKTKPNFERRTLGFPGIDLQSIQSNKPFFKSLLIAAEEESIRRQELGGLGPLEHEPETPADFDADAVLSSEIKLEQKAGFQSNPRIRKAVENRAMEVVRLYYGKLSLQNTSQTCPYDYSYMDGRTFYIEVKGSQLKDPSIVLTKNEVQFARKHLGDIKLCVVHSIVIENTSEPIAKGGVLVEFPHWNPDEHKLAITQYQCKLDRTLGLTK